MFLGLELFWSTRTRLEISQSLVTNTCLDIVQMSCYKYLVLLAQTQPEIFRLLVQNIPFLTPQIQLDVSQRSSSVFCHNEHNCLIKTSGIVGINNGWRGHDLQSVQTQRNAKCCGLLSNNIQRHHPPPDVKLNMFCGDVHML